MAVEFRLWCIGLAELQVLVLAYQGARDGAVAVRYPRRRSKDRRIEIGDALRGADRHVELDVGNAERDTAEACGVRLVDAHAVAPRTRRLDIIVVFAEA